MGELRDKVNMDYVGWDGWGWRWSGVEEEKGEYAP